MVSQGASAIFVTGDLGDDGGLTDEQAAKGSLDPSGVPYYVVPGNHDECPGFDSDQPCTQTWEQYDAVFNSRHFSFTTNRVTFIGFTSWMLRGRPGGPAFGITNSELSYVQGELNSHPNNSIVLLTHAPLATDWGYYIVDGYGREDIVSMIQAHGRVVAWLSGHRHMNANIASLYGLTNINLPSLAYCVDAGDGKPWVNGAYMIGDLTDTTLTFHGWLANPPTYTDMTTNIVIQLKSIPDAIRSSRLKAGVLKGK